MKKTIKMFSLILISIFAINITNVKADEELDKQFEEIYKNEVKDGVYEINYAVKPRSYNEFDAFVSYLHNDYYNGKYKSLGIYYGVECNDNIECYFYISKGLLYTKKYEDVIIKWAEPNTMIKKNIDSYIEKLAKIQGKSEYGYYNTYYFELTDLNLINYYVTSNTRELSSSDFCKITNYTEDVKKFFDNADLTYEIDTRAGVEYTPFNTRAFGNLIVSYNGLRYAAQESVGARTKEILYVPSDTEINDESLINAALKRLKEYMPNNKITITKGKALNTYLDDANQEIDFTEITDLTKTTDHTYTFNFGDFTVDFLIVADSSKMTVPVFAAKNLDKDITVTSKESSIPLDTMIIAKNLDKDSKEYQIIKKSINQNNLHSLDITLFSNVKNSKITKLENGIFEVTMPVPADLEGKNLAIYYVTDDGKVEEHEVTIKDGYATFQTNHFSIYTLAEKTNSIVNPKTGDNISLYIILSISSLIMLTVCSICLSYKNKRVKNN